MSLSTFQKPEVLHTKRPKGSMHECQIKLKKQNPVDDMVARLVTDPNSLAPYDTLCPVLEVVLTRQHLCLYSICSGEGTGPGSER